MTGHRRAREGRRQPLSWHSGKSLDANPVRRAPAAAAAGKSDKRRQRGTPGASRLLPKPSPGLGMRSVWTSVCSPPGSRPRVPDAPCGARPVGTDGRGCRPRGRWVFRVPWTVPASSRTHSPTAVKVTMLHLYPPHSPPQKNLSAIPNEPESCKINNKRTQGRGVWKPPRKADPGGLSCGETGLVPFPGSWHLCSLSNVVSYTGGAWSRSDLRTSRF